jgi:serine/threonine protein kinase/class 3 adenylate cyclase
MSGHESKLDQLLRQRAEVDELLRRHHTPITVLFTDIVGSTAYFDRYGDIAGVAMLHRHESLATSVVAEFGGRTIKNIGDSVMAEFPDPVQAARAAVEIQRRLLRENQKLDERDRLQLRVGINHGLGFRQADDVFGDVVNVAARIMKKTGPAQICVGKGVREAVVAHPELRCNPLGEVTLQGKEEKEAIFELVWTETSAYEDLRRNVTSALRRGDLVAPGVDVNELTVPPTPPETPPPSPLTPWSTPPPGATPPSDTGLAGPPVKLETRYEMLEELGSGGMGVVYKARDRETGDLVALKVLRPEVAANAKGMARFKNELRIARRITHKNVCRIHEFNRTENSAFISMEYVEGESLRHLLNRVSVLGPGKAVGIARQMCAGLREAHAQGVVHRDLKPENVMIDSAGTVRIMDFGIAHSALGGGMTQTDTIIGTPTYMSPEQAEGRKVDHRTDIYAVGLVMYEMFTGSPTFTAETPVAVAIKHIRETPIDPHELEPSVPEHISSAILKCLEKKPENRFQSVDELEAALAQLPVPTPAEAPAISTSGTVIARPTPVPTPAPQPTPYAQTQMATPWSATPPPISPTPVPPIPTPPPLTQSGTIGVTPPQPTIPEAPPIQAQPAPAPVAVPVPAPVVRPKPRAGIFVGLIVVFAIIVVVGGYFAFRALRAPEGAQAPVEQAQQAQQPAEPAAKAPAEQPPATQAPMESGQAQAPSEQPTPTIRVRELPPPTLAGKGEAGRMPERPRAEAPATGPAPSRVAPLVIGFSLGRTLAGHTQSVSSVAFSPDGRMVVTGSRDRSVRLWEMGTGRQVQIMKGHVDAISSVAFSPDGRVVVSSSLDKTIRMWDPGSGRELSALPKDNAFVLAIAFSPDGHLLAYSTSEGRIKVWDWEAKQGLNALDGHTGPVYAIAFSPDGRWLASAGRDQTVRIWDVAAGRELRTLRGHSEPVNTVAFSPDGRLVASGGEDKSVNIWEAATGRPVRSLTGHAAGVTSVVFGSDSRWLASASDDKTVKIWDVANGNEVTTLAGHIYGITHLEVSRDGRWLASAAGDNTVRLWRRE